MPAPPEPLLTVLAFDDQRPLGQPLGLLWPTWQWQVIVPRRSAGLDLIERAVLGLLATRWRSVELLASTLGLDAGVVELVLERLRQDGLVGEDAVTAEGIGQVLGEGRGRPNEELTTAFVWADPFRERLWMHASQDRPSEHAVVTFSDGMATLAGSRGEREGKKQYYVVRRHSGAPRRPEAIDVLNTLRAAVHDASGPADTALVRFPREAAQLVHLRLYVYPATHGFADRPWEVTNPFGHGVLPGIRASVELGAKRDPRLDELIARKLRTPRARDARGPSAPAAGTPEAGSGLLGDLHVHHAEVDASLRELQTKAAAGYTDAKRLDPIILAADLLRQAVASCAASALDLANDGRPARPWLGPERATRAACVRDLADRLGFDRGIPASTSCATPEEVRAALAGDARSLRALTVAALFSAHEHSRHPLRALVVRVPDLPVVLLRIAERGDATLQLPGADEERTDVLAELLGDVRSAVRVLAPLLEELQRAADEATELSTVGARS